MAWDKTQKMKARLGIKGEFYKGRHIIHRHSKIDGGVYLGETPREAIVVDSKKYSKLKELYSTAKNKAVREGNFTEENVLQAVYDSVAEAMPIQDEDAVERIINCNGAEKDRKISLDVFIERGVGSCRHDALACGALLELFKEDGIIKGVPRVNRNQQLAGGHAWCRYINPDGKIYILDVSQKYIGPLKDAIAFYGRPDEISFHENKGFTIMTDILDLEDFKNARK